MSRARMCDPRGGRHPTDIEPRRGCARPHQKLVDLGAQVSHVRDVHQFGVRKEHIRVWTRSLDERARAVPDRTQPVGKRTHVSNKLLRIGSGRSGTLCGRCRDRLDARRHLGWRAHYGG